MFVGVILRSRTSVALAVLTTPYDASAVDIVIPS